ncbi:MAG: hypothetical protein NTX03_08505, partial [Bacteroidetes bacterium]|nr:hypothetical protein [Bacteroidota bacterium]
MNLGAYTFAKNTFYNLEAYSSSPNGGTDANPTDDTLFKVSLNGTYIIGGSTYDYANFSDAVSALDSFGICGPVIFNIADGTYTEQIEMGVINGTSSINTITFQSASGDSSKVILAYPSSTAKNYVVHLSGASFISFKKITIKSIGTARG